MNVVIATTGTGGDLFPGIAVAEELRNRGAKILFIVSGLGPEEVVLQRNQFSFERIHVGKLKGQDFFAKAKTFVRLPAVIWSARNQLRHFPAEVVFGTGGHSSGPVMVAASLLGLPRAVLEQNAIPGLTNRLLSRWVDRIYTGFPGMESFFPKRKVLWTGTPIRKNFRQVSPKQEGEFTLLVLGGSQGAASLNQAMLEAFPVLQRSNRKIKVIHQTGTTGFENVQQRYATLGALPGEVEVFSFISGMEEVYQRSDLVVARAGASTLSELVAVCRPALLVPYPFAAHDHQRLNALWLVQEGGAEMILDREISSPGGGEKLAHKILHYESDRETLGKMREAIGRLSRREATVVIAEDLIRLGG